MSKELQAVRFLLVTILHGDRKLKNFVLERADKKLVKALTECVYNALYNTSLKFTEKEKNRLAKYRKELRKVSCKKTNLKSRKQIFVQRGGSFLPILLPAIFTLISTLS